MNTCENGGEGENTEGEDIAGDQVHSLAEGVGDAIEALRSRVEHVVKDADKALLNPHFPETHYANMHTPAVVKEVKGNTMEIDHDREDQLKRKKDVDDLSQSMINTIDLLLDSYDSAKENSSTQAATNTPSCR